SLMFCSLILFLSFFNYVSDNHPYLPSFPTRRSSDLDIRRGVGMSVFWYNTGVWPISLETSACRMVLNQDGSIQVQVGETEIGQGDRKSTRLNSSHVSISYAVFCLKKKKNAT